MSDTTESIDALRHLRTLSGGRSLSFVTDDRDLFDQLRSLAFDAYLWSPDLALADGTTIVLALCHQLVSRAVRKQFRNDAVLVLPVNSFDDSAEAIAYTFALMLATDYEQACTRNRCWLDLLRNKPDGVLRFSGAGTDLNCHLHDRLRASTSLSPMIEPGEWVSIADYCEVSVTAPSQSDWCGAFTIDGHVEAAGVLVAEDSRSTSEGKARIGQAKQLRDHLVEIGPVSLDIDGGVLRSAVAAGRDWTEVIAAVTNPDYGLHTLELGLGSNPGIGHLVDWRINSQLNEGAGPVHLGFGEGMTGAHMDFIVAEAAQL
jgi:hypothetical protein